MQIPIPRYGSKSAGIYIHIPFCRKACNYCNFHFSTSFRHKSALLQSIIYEISSRYQYLQGKTVHTIYFGGGTPSVLEKDEILNVLSFLKKYFDLAQNVEITFEANPDDLDRAYLEMLIKLGVTRLSIGLQSFNERELNWMRRSHSARQSIEVLELLQEYPALDYSADLIYGVPGSTETSWQQQLETIVQYRTPHLSCYNLTVEPNTMLYHEVARGKVSDVDDTLSQSQFLIAHDFLKSQGYSHYEISNYAREGKYSQHNTAYWFGVYYLGLGPGAHSYNGSSRSWNVANNARYIEVLTQQQLPLDTEVLTPSDKTNEAIMTGLRTMWGISSNNLNENQQQIASKMIQQGLAVRIDDRLMLTTQGMLKADVLAAELFVD